MIILEDLMSQPNFGKALDNLVPEYREQFALPKIHQLGLVVADVEKAGIVIEFISQRCFGLKWWPLDAIFKVAARLEKWSGKRSIAV